MDFGPASEPVLEETPFGSQSVAQSPQAPAFFKQTQQGNTPKFQKPSFADTQNNPALAQKADTKGGKLLSFFLSVANGGAAGAGQPTFGGGFLMAQGAQMQRQQAADRAKQQQIENQRQAQEETRRQQEADQQNANYKSEADLRAQQIEESKAKIGAKDRSPQDVYDEDIKNGLTPPQALEHAYNIKAPNASEKNPTEDSLAYTAENDTDPAKRKAASAALERITKNKIKVSAAGRSVAEGDKEDKRRLDADVTGYYGHVISQGGDTTGAENILKERLKDPKLTPYQKQVASETLRRVRAEQQAVLR